MPKLVDYGHPTVELKFRTIQTPNGQTLMAQVHDTLTGEVLMVETLLDMSSWLKTMGYKWLEGSNGVWHQP